MTNFGDSLSLSVNVHNPTAARQQISLTIQDANGNDSTQAEYIEPGQTKTVFLGRTLVVLGTEFDFTPRINDDDRRDCHDRAFTCMLVSA